MLHIKSQGHGPSGSGEKDFKRGFTIYGHGSHLGHVTYIPSPKVISLLVLEKIFKGFLPYMGVAAILVM